jgi:uncharacterized membrane-anchored protein YitT (DUF2179 family)
MWIFNVPLYIWGVRELGSSFGTRTFYAFSVNSLFIDLLRGSVPGLSAVRLQDAEAVLYLREHDFLFLVLLGATLLGVGLGIVFKFRGTTGGSDIVAAIAQKRWGLRPGQTIMFTDFFVIVFAGLIIEFKDLAEGMPAAALTLYAFLLLFLSSKLIDMVIDGFDYARSVYIISDRHAQIAEAIMSRLERGVTAFHGRGLYRGIERDILFTVVRRNEVRALADEVRLIDPQAFMIISNVYEVQGEGFRLRTQLSLPKLGKANGNGNAAEKVNGGPAETANGKPAET